jgi:hypothetical protein
MATPARILDLRARRASYRPCAACGDTDVRRGLHCDSCALEIDLRARNRNEALARLIFKIGSRVRP